MKDAVMTEILDTVHHLRPKTRYILEAGNAPSASVLPATKHVMGCRITEQMWAYTVYDK
jgi:hypothetical protein